MKRWVSILMIVVFCSTLSAQNNPKVHSPTKAALFSTFLPGAGQIYNKKYWKPPIVWGGLALFTYLYINENNRYQNAKKSYLTLIDTIPNNDIPFNGTSNVEIVQSSKNVYRNQRDMYLIFGLVFYALNIVDAAVDAHFFNFNVNDNLSLHLNSIPPHPLRPQITPVVNLTYNFSK